MEAMRGRTPNYLNVVFTTMRDLFGEDVAKQVRDAKHASQVFNSQWGNVLDDILKPFKGLRGAKSRVRIGKLLDGTPVEGVTDAERLAARELREKFRSEERRVGEEGRAGWAAVAGDDEFWGEVG